MEGVDDFELGSRAVVGLVAPPHEADRELLRTMTRLAGVCSGKTVATTHDDLVRVAESRSLHTCALYVHDEKGVIILSGRR